MTLLPRFVREQVDKVFDGHVPGVLSDALVGLMKVTIDVLGCYERRQPIESAHFFSVHRMASAYNVLDNESQLSCCVYALATMLMEFSGSLLVPHTALEAPAAPMGMVPYHPSTPMMSLPQLAPVVPPWLVVPSDLSAPSLPMQWIDSTMAVTRQDGDNRADLPSDVKGEIGGPPDVKRRRIEPTAAAALTEQQEQPGNSRVDDANDDTILDVVGLGVLGVDNNTPHSPVVPPHSQVLTTPLAVQTVAATPTLQPMVQPGSSAAATTGEAHTADTNDDAARKAARAAFVAASAAQYSPLIAPAAAPTVQQQLQPGSGTASTNGDANDDTTSNVSSGDSGDENSVSQPLLELPLGQVRPTPLTEQMAAVPATAAAILQPTQQSMVQLQPMVGSQVMDDEGVDPALGTPAVDAMEEEEDLDFGVNLDGAEEEEHLDNTQPAFSLEEREQEEGEDEEVATPTTSMLLQAQHAVDTPPTVPLQVDRWDSARMARSPAPDRSPVPTAIDGLTSIADQCKEIKDEPVDEFDQPGTSSPVRRPSAAILTSSSFGKDAAHRRMNDEEYREFVHRQLAKNQMVKANLEKWKEIKEEIKEEEPDEEEKEMEEEREEGGEGDETTAEVPDSCEMCDMQYEKGGFTRHMEAYHRLNSECDKRFCDFFSQDDKELKEHKKNAHKGKRGYSFKNGTCCPHCQLPLKNLGGYVAHLKKEHVEEMTSEEQIHVCDECGTETKRIHEMIEHWKQKKCAGTLLMKSNAVAGNQQRQ
ncbi:hypothetical protein PENTCL1PPCAC_15211 [Pristionchus entomophagus]|uniref:C2H2-type domain-containing protein n=1 Tax=Pristionchus entomophagus TaxID=358040 RepID=A0AAV5TGX4_9BILA|nr:hypothetical protein PENTCL1PPCAC_15211 [Pristionchus entomophagus]